MTANEKTAEELLEAIETELSLPSAPLSVKDFWSQSLSQSVMSDYSNGRVRNVQCG